MRFAAPPTLEGRATLDAIPPGRYVVHAVGSQRSRCRQVTVRSGQTTTVELPRDERPEQVLTIRRPGEEEAMFSARILDADGVLDGVASMPPTNDRDASMRIRTPGDGRAFTVVLLDRNMAELTRRTFVPGEDLVLEIDGSI